MANHPDPNKKQDEESFYFFEAEDNDSSSLGYTQPSIFLPIGPPTFLFEESEARTAFQLYGDYCSAPGRKPSCIICISARWESDEDSFKIMTSANPKTVHDFSGFPEALYDIEYLAKGSVQGAARVAEALSMAGIEWEFDARRGFDFGCWSPLAPLFPDADIPVLQISLHGSLEPKHHIALGEALSPLRHEGFLILCTGGVTHNPMEISLSEQPPPLWAETVDTFVANVLLAPAADGDEATAWRERSRRLAACDGSERVAAAMATAHPAGTYLLPLLVAAASGGACATLHRGWIHGCLSAAAYVFGAEVPAAAARRHLANMAR